MNIALFAQSGIFGSLQSLVRWCTDRRPATQQWVTPPTKIRLQIAPKSLANRPLMTGATTTLKPLRVIRVVESGQSRSSIGRIVISGRMADVCAELDRLAAGEAAIS